MENRQKENGLKRLTNTERKKQILPPCRVCRSPGAGCHYGVVTCGGCKGFFHRALQYHTQYKCEKNERCDIMNAKGKLCQRCRYQTCLDVGMSKDAIRTGRYTLKERTKYILEIKGMLNGKHSSKRNTSQKAGNKQSTKFQNDCHEKRHQSPTPMDAEHHPSQVTQMTPASSFVSPDTMFYHQQAPIQSPTIGDTHVYHGTSPSQQYSSDAEGRLYEDIKPNSSAIDCPQFVQNFFDSSLSQEKQRYITDLFSYNTSVLTTLMESHERHLGPFCKSIMNKNILAETELHYELCKHDALSPAEPVQPNPTSLSSSIQDHYFGDYGEDVECYVRKMVCFIKSVPAFSCLDMSDKINLIKLGRLEFSFISFYNMMNYDLGVVYEFSNQGWICPYDLIRYNFEDKIPLLRDYVRLSRKLNNLNLSQEEIVVLKTMSILTPDRTLTRDTSMIQEIHWRLTQLLMFLLSKRHNRPKLVFAKIVDILTEFRSVERGVNNFFATLNLRQSDMFDKPLTKEMLTGIVFSGDL